MDKSEEALKLIESSDEPEGVTVQAADGRLFFLSKADAERTLIPPNDLYVAFRAVRQPRHRDAFTENCGRIWKWVETHSPDSAKWRRLTLLYFEVCV
jgi:hypothetical protein